jgi:hypothetical protein
LSARSPDGIANLAAEGDAVDDLVSLALIAMNGQTKKADAFLKLLPGSAAAMIRPSETELVWHVPEQPEKDPPEQLFEVYVRQLGPTPEAAQYLVRMIQAWDAAGRPNNSQLRLRGIPAGSLRSATNSNLTTTLQLKQGCFIPDRIGFVHLSVAQ